MTERLHSFYVHYRPDGVIVQSSTVVSHGLPPDVPGTTALWVESLPSSLRGYRVVEGALVAPVGVLLEETCSQKMKELKAGRDADLLRFVWDGSSFDCDTSSQISLTLQYIKARDFPGESVSWRLADNSWRTLSSDDVVQVFLAMKAHIGAVFSHFQDLESQVNGANAEGLQSIHWR